MADTLRRHIFGATELTRIGQLQKATAVLQAALGNRSPVHREDTTPSPAAGPGGEFLLRAAGAPLTRLVQAFQALPGEGLADLFGEPAPQPDGAPGRFLSASFSNEAGTRPYKLYVPSGYQGQPVPLIVMLHGCTQSPDDFAAGTRMNLLAEEHGCIVCYPAQTAAANASRCWNWFNAAQQKRDRGEPSLIAGITRQVIRDYAIDQSRVYVAGLSAGGALAATMGELYPDLFAAIGVHSGLACGSASDVGSAFAAMRQGGHGAARVSPPRGAAGRAAVPAVVFHGDGDNTVHPSNGDDVIEQALHSAALGTRVEQGKVVGGRSYTRTLHEDEDGQTVHEQWTVHGAGHAWSGGSASGSYTDPLGPDASREMLRFFLDHPRQGGPE